MWIKLGTNLVGEQYIYGGTVEAGEIASKENRLILKEVLNKWHEIKE